MTTHFSAKSNHGAKSQVFESFNFVVEDAEDHIRLIRIKRDQLTKDLEEQIRLLTDRTYRPVRYTWRSDVNGNVRKVLLLATFLFQHEQQDASWTPAGAGWSSW